MGSQTAGDVSESDVHAGRRASQPRRPVATLRWRSLFTTCLVTLLLVSTWAALATTYIYDPNGRLAVVTNDAGESARYRYDALGNLVEIERLAADDLAVFVFGFSPRRGAPGVVVRISGHSFSPTAGQNTVRFNGTVASVSAASNTALTAIVPAGAATGPITVTVGGETASSTTDFIVDENAKPPVITNVSPLIARVGTAITVNGQTLAPVSNQTMIRLNQRPALPTTLTNLQAVFPVPAGTSSGRVSVTTPYGTAVSDQDVLVTPGNVLPGEITQIKRLAADAAAQGFSVTTTGHYGAALFDSSSGDYLSAQFSSISVASISYTLYSIGNTVLASGTVSSSSPTFHLPRLPTTGTYLLLMKPVTGPSTWNVAIEKAKPVVANGDQLPVATTTLGQSKRLTFTAGAGASLGLGLSDLVTPGSSSYVQIHVYKPYGSSLISENCYASYSSCQLNLSNLAAGTYSVVIRSPSNGNRTMSFQTTLSSDVVGTLPRDTATTLSLPRRGQNARLTFDGTAGETVALQMAGQTTVPANGSTNYIVYKPDGSLLTSTSTASGATLNLPNLPETGDYTVFVDPSRGETLSTQVLLASGTTGSEEIDGNSGTYATTVSGQNVYLTFVASEGANLGLGISDLVTPGSTLNVRVNVYKPNGSSLIFGDCYALNNGCQLNLLNLTAGTYSVIIQPPSNGGRTMSFQTTLSSNTLRPLARDMTQTLTLARRGQNGMLTFAGTAGETVALQLAAQTTVPANRVTYYTVYKPDGSLLASTGTTSEVTLNLPNLPVTGDYAVFVDPRYGETLSVQMLLAPGMTGDEEVDGESGAYVTTIPGQNVYLAFTADAGQNLGLGISNIVTPGSTSAIWVDVYGPSGSRLHELYCSAAGSGCDINLPNLTAGIYSLVIAPPADGNRTMSFRMTLSSDVTGDLPRDTAAALNLARRGQNGRLTFTGTQGETVALQILGQTTTSAEQNVRYTVYRPNGSYWTSITVTTAPETLNISNLPVTGTYTLFVDPVSGATLVAEISLASGARDLIELDGASETVVTIIPGQHAYLAFTAAAGMDLGLGISELTTSRWTSGWVSIDVLKPDGTSLVRRSCDVQYYRGCGLNLSDLEAGTYTVVATPPYEGQHAMTMSFKATLSSDIVHTLQPNVAVNLSLARRGQNGQLTFAGVEGQAVALQVAGQTTVPVNRSSYYYVYKPDGSYLTGAITGSSTTLNLPNLPVIGNYTVFVDPVEGEALTVQLTLDTTP